MDRKDRVVKIEWTKHYVRLRYLQKQKEQAASSRLMLPLYHEKRKKTSGCTIDCMNTVSSVCPSINL